MRIEHGAVWTRDLERLRAFYARWFGATAGGRYESTNRPGFASYFLALPDEGARLELMRLPDLADAPGAPALGYVLLTVAVGSEAAVRTMAERMREAGVPIVSGPRWTGDGYFEVLVRDPDGNEVEITADPQQTQGGRGTKRLRTNPRAPSSGINHARMRRRSIRLALFLPLLLAADLLRAQSLGVSAGPVIPVGPLGEHRDVGLRVQGSLYSPERLLRVDLAATLFPGDNRDWQAGDYRSLSLGANLLPVFHRAGGTRVRGLIGLSAHKVDVEGASNPYGIIPGLQLGTVLEGAWGGRALHAETGLHVIASDHGVGELEGAYFVPVTFGIRF